LCFHVHQIPGNFDFLPLFLWWPTDHGAMCCLLSRCLSIFCCFICCWIVILFYCVLNCNFILLWSDSMQGAYFNLLIYVNTCFIMYFGEISMGYWEEYIHIYTYIYICIYIYVYIYIYIYSAVVDGCQIHLIHGDIQF
jgi:hypothetical protein